MRSLQTLLIVTVGALTLAFTPAVMAQQKLQISQSDISFTSKQMGVPVEGHFRKFDAQLNFDPVKPETSSIAFVIDTGSATLGAKESEAEVAKAAWFNVAQFPQAKFTSSKVAGLGGGRFEVSGKLTIKGNSRDILIPVTLTQSGASTQASGSFVLKRLSYQIGDGEWSDTSLVADEVLVKFRLSLTGVRKF